MLSTHTHQLRAALVQAGAPALFHAGILQLVEWIIAAEVRIAVNKA